MGLLSRKPYDYVCCLFGFAGIGIIFCYPIIGWWSLIGIPIVIAALAINLSLALRDAINEKNTE